MPKGHNDIHAEGPSNQALCCARRWGARRALQAMC
jgi:hypothetical protein